MKKEFIVLGGGCFWCLEAACVRLKGILDVLPGYAGGHTKNPTYEEVSRGQTGHAEVVKIEYDASKVSLEKILEVFFTIHDPTTLNRQGADIGTQYRSIVLYNNKGQKEIAGKTITKLGHEKKYDGPIVTELKELERFWPAEDSHQKFYEKHPEKAYCQVVIRPKIEKASRLMNKEKNEKS